MNDIIQNIQIKIKELERTANNVDFAQRLNMDIQKGINLNVPFTISFGNEAFSMSGIVQTEEQKELIDRILVSTNKQHLQIHKQQVQKLKTEILELAKKLKEDT